MQQKSIFKQCEENSQKTDTYVFSEKLPKTIKVVKKLPTAGEKLVYEEVPIAEVEKKYNFTWVEGLVGPEEFIKKYANKAEIEKTLDSEEKKNLETLIGNSVYRMDNLALYVNDKMGCGLIYVGKNPIPENGAAAYYAGAFAESCESMTNAYVAGGHNSALFTKEKDIAFTSQIDAEKFGNISRFFNSAPANLDNYEFTPGVKCEDILVANLNSVTYQLKEVSLVTFETNRKISSDSITCLSYGDEYWGMQEVNGKGSQLLMYKDGSIVPPYMYRFKKAIPVPCKVRENVFRAAWIPPMLPAQSAVTVSRNVSSQPSQEVNQSVNNANSSSVIEKQQQIKPVEYSEIIKALIRNKYVYAGALKNPSKITSNKVVESSPALEILRQYVDAKFNCYERPEDEILVKCVQDAVIKFKDEDEKTTIINKLAFSGLFPKIVNNMIIIEGINQEHIFNNVMRIKITADLEKAAKDLHVDGNSKSNSQSSSNNMEEAINDLKKSVKCWAILSQDIPPKRNDLAQVLFDLGCAYEKSGHKTNALVYFHLSGKMYLQVNKKQKAQEANVRKQKHIDEIENLTRAQQNPSSIASSAQAGITQFPLPPKIEDLLKKFDFLLKKFLDNPDVYRAMYKTLPDEQQLMLDLYLQIEGVSQIKIEPLKVEATNTMKKG